jgi:alpha-amylase/alpha-mannosidase (GH57 family)
MADGKRIHLALLWHMHQPPYEDPRTGVFLLPWTYLHATKDYYDMGEVVRRHPRMRMNFNFTPSLLWQLEQYRTGALADQTIEVLGRPLGQLKLADREFVMRTCFGINPDTMIARFPRYRELHERFRAFPTALEAALQFGPEDYRDLSVLYLLAWSGPTLHRDARIAALVAKGRDYTDDDRQLVLACGRELIGRIVPLYRDLAAQGLIELSTSPFHHPLTPLIVSNACAVEASPGLPLPDVRFGAPDEAGRQIDMGRSYFERTFGRPAVGMWPPEGAVSEAAVELFGSRGVRWLATDEEILKRSLDRDPTLDERCRPWSRAGVSVFFRDHVLSDQIGFVYSRWPRATAVRHFVDSLRGIADALTGDGDALVLVALDGENAWEYYPDGGYPFLDELYGAIEAADFIVPTTLSEWLDRNGPGEELRALATGSWIGGNLETWIGDPVKNRAWSLLAATWQLARDVPNAPECSGSAPGPGESFRCPLLRAEASDWFWWFGKGHSSVHEREFDYLFRQNLVAVYERLGLPHPDTLDRPLGGEASLLPVVPPSDWIRPAITGRRDGFYKWVGAGSCEFSHGAIHRLQPTLAGVRFGFDRDLLFLRCDGFEPLARALADDGWVRFRFRRPEDCTLRVRWDGGRLVVERLDGPDAGPIDDAEAAVDEVLEVGVPIRVMPSIERATGPTSVEFYVQVGRGALEVERFPWDSVVAFEFDRYDFVSENWFV